MRNQFQSDDRAEQGNDEKNPGETRRFAEDENPQQHRTESSHAGPNSVRGTDRERLHGFGQQTHTQHCRQDEPSDPKIKLRTLGPLVFPKQKVMATSKTPAINNTIQFIVFSLVFIPNYQSEECSAPRFRTTRQRQSLFHNTQTHSSLVRSDHRIKILPTPAGGPPAKAGRGREYRAAWLPPDGRRCRPARAAS